jgi:hypothetical protein
MNATYRKRALPAILLFVLIGWQLTFVAQRHTLTTDYALPEIIGLHRDVFHNFLYFFHYLGVFPVGSEVLQREYSKAGAEAFVKEHGSSLRMDLMTGAGKMGDYGKIFLYLPDVWVSGSPEKAQVKLFNMFFFMTSLVALFISFWINGYPLLGGLLAIFIGSDPFQLYQTYRFHNVFSITISLAVLALALNFRFFLPKVEPRSWHFALAALCGALTAFSKCVRVESSFIFYAIFLIYLVMQAPWKHRAALMITLVVTSTAASRFYESWSNRIYQRSVEFVESHGGVPYKGPRRQHHVVWHTLAAGLGDYGQKHGYAWNDTKIFEYGVPKMIERYFPNYSWTPGSHWLNNSHDGNGVYPIQPEDLPEYELVMREKILGDIVSDPLWYVGVLMKRTWRILTETTPVSLAIGHHRIGAPLHGLLVLIFLAFLVYAREWVYVRLILFTLPLSLGSLLHFSGSGMTYYAIYHLIAFSIALSFLIRSRRPALR